MERLKAEFSQGCSGQFDNGRESISDQLEFVTAEELVLFALGAVCAFKAANKKNSYPQRDQNGQHTRVRADHLNQSMHKPR